MDSKNEATDGQVAITPESPKSEILSDSEDIYVGYKLSWRTFLAVFILAFTWACTTIASAGVNSAIQYIIADFPTEASKATWIPSSGLLCVVTVPPIIGASSDRYGKKWFILGGCLLAIIGTAVSSTANNVNTVIGGQVLSATGCSGAIMSLAAGMEVVPAKHRMVSVAFMAIFNGTLGTIGGVFIFAACVQHGLGWRWGFKILAILFAVAFIAVAFLYNPPPTSFRRQGTFKSLIKSIDFVGIGILALGAGLTALPLILGGAVYPWDSSKVIPFLVIGPLLLVAFGLYEWKGRSGGLLDHAFFKSRSFAVFLIFGFVDGMLLYGTSVFIPEQIGKVYKSKPIEIATILVAFNGTILAGFIFFGFLSGKSKQFRWPLVASSIFLTMFCGLTTRAKSSNLGYFEGMLSGVGFFTAATETIPVVGIALVVPSNLIATSNQVLGTARSLGGLISIAVFTAIYQNKAAIYVPENVIPVLAMGGVPQAEYPTILQIVANAPQMLASVPGLTPQLIGGILGAAQVGNAESYKYIWYCIMASGAACIVAALFLVDEPQTMNDLVESALEPSKVREKQEDHV